jgi:hypothetical protein
MPACLAVATTAESARIEPLLSTVMRGLDPRIHLLPEKDGLPGQARQ